MSTWKFGILSKIMLTCVPVLAVLGGFCAYSTYTFSRVMAQFTAVNASWKASTVAAGNENGVLAMRSDAGRFLTTGSEQPFKSAMRQAEGIGRDLARNEDTAADEDSRRLLQEARAALDEFTRGLQELAGLQAERGRVLQEAILTPASALDKTFAEVMQTSYHDGDAATAFQAGTAIAGLAKAGGAIQQFLQTADAKVAQDVDDGLKTVAESTALIVANATSRFIKRQLAETGKQRMDLANGFSTLAEITNRRDKLMDEVINRRADRLLAIFTGFRERSEAVSESVTTGAHAQSAAALRLNVLGAAAGVSAALLVAFLLGRSIAGRVTALARITRRLAEGDNGVTVPFLGSRDEVGDMAASIQVFKENAEQLERMRAEKSRMEQAAQNERRREMRELAEKFEAAVGGIVETVSSASSQLEASASSLIGTASEAQQLSSGVTTASGEAAKNVESIASAAEQLTASIAGISRQVNDSSRIATEAVQQARQTSSRIHGLSEAAARIGEVVQSIASIASQTNLLALNATIEAARAGEAGRGFGVVAHEVKALATQTANATAGIGSQIEGIQAATADSVEAIGAISATIDRIAEIAGSVASSITEQESATHGISHSVLEAVKCTSRVASNIVAVNRGASDTGASATQLHTSAKSLSEEAKHLRQETTRFLQTVRAAS